MTNQSIIARSLLFIEVDHNSTGHLSALQLLNAFRKPAQSPDFTDTLQFSSSSIFQRSSGILHVAHDRPGDCELQRSEDERVCANDNIRISGWETYACNNTTNPAANVRDGI